MQTALNPKPTDDPHDVLVVAPGVAVMVPTDEELSKLARSLRHPPLSASLHRGRPSPGRNRSAGRYDVSPRRCRRCEGPGPAADDGRKGGTRPRGRVGGGSVHGWRFDRLAVLWRRGRGHGRAVGAAARPRIAAAGKTRAGRATAGSACRRGNRCERRACASRRCRREHRGRRRTAAAASAETAPSLGSMANELASARQEIEQLKATIEQLKAGQQQMSRDMAKASDARVSEAKVSPEVRASEARMSEVRPSELRPKTPAHPPRTAAVRARKPRPPPPLQQAATAPVLPQAAPLYVPRQVAPPPQTTGETLTDPELASVPRPPMPVR